MLVVFCCFSYFLLFSDCNVKCKIYVWIREQFSVLTDDHLISNKKLIVGKYKMSFLSFISTWHFANVFFWYKICLTKTRFIRYIRKICWIWPNDLWQYHIPSLPLAAIYLLMHYLIIRKYIGKIWLIQNFITLSSLIGFRLTNSSLLSNRQNL